VALENVLKSILLILPNLTLCAVLLFSCGQKPSKNSIPTETCNHYLANGYTINELRGMWKIAFSED
jgi:hypothetical protein